MMKRNSRALCALLIILGVIVIDQIVKYLVKTNFSLYESLPVTSWFELVFTENTGMAFGMNPVSTVFLALFRIAAIGLFGYMLLKLVRKPVSMGLLVCFSLIVAGATANIIDNMFYGLIYQESLPYAAPAQLVPFGQGYGSFLEGKVVDMFYFPLFTWPESFPLVGGKVFFGAIFNVADAAISCGAVALVLFYYRQMVHLKP